MRGAERRRAAAANREPDAQRIFATVRGYVLVGCNIVGTNAFFVRADLAKDPPFCAPFTAGFGKFRGAGEKGKGTTDEH